MIEGRTIMIVGNGPVKAHVGAAIDAADIVIRFNDCRTYGQAGTKTDIVAVCNTGRPAVAMLTGSSWKADAPVRRAKGIWCVRSPEKFAALRPEIEKRWPELADLCDDYTDDFRAFAEAAGHTFRVVPAAVHDAVETALGAFAPGDYVVPSSGMIVIADVLANARSGDRVLIAGFGHVGWEGHPFAAERRYVDQLITAGRLGRLEHVSASLHPAYISTETAGGKPCSIP